MKAERYKKNSFTGYCLKKAWGQTIDQTIAMNIMETKPTAHFPGQREVVTTE